MIRDRRVQRRNTLATGGTPPDGCKLDERAAHRTTMIELDGPLGPRGWRHTLASTLTLPFQANDDEDQRQENGHQQN
jgi:hypothetical protein